MSTQSLPTEMGERFRFWACRPSLPAAWLALLLTKAGDVGWNPGSTTHTNKHTLVIWICDLCHKQETRNKTQSDVTTHTTGSSEMHTDKTATIQTWLQMHHSYTHTKLNNNTKHRQHNSPSQTNHHPPTHKQQSMDKNIVIFQININGIRHKIKELKKSYTGPNRTSSQYKKQNSHIKLNTYNIPLHHHTHRQRAQTRRGRGIITLIKDDIIFTNINIPNAINTHNTKLQLIKIHTCKTKDITVANTYFLPRDTTLPHYSTMDTDIAYCIRHVTNIPDSTLTCDVNAHATLWYSHTDDHRGQLISDIIGNSEHITLHNDTPSRVPNTTLQ